MMILYFKSSMQLQLWATACSERPRLFDGYSREGRFGDTKGRATLGNRCEPQSELELHTLLNMCR
jgi:hypothetical protein